MNPVRLWRRLSPRDRRALRLGGLALVPALLWAFAVSPYLDVLSRYADRLEAQRSLLQAERDLVAGGEGYPAAVKAASTRLQRLAPRFLDSRGSGVAGAELTQFVEDRARAHRVHLTRTDPRPARRLDAHLVAVPLVVEGESDLRGLLGFLDALESGGKLLRVDGLRLQQGAARRDDEMQALRLRATVVGVMLRPEGSEDGGDGEGRERGGPAGGRQADGARPGGEAGALAAGEVPGRP